MLRFNRTPGLHLIPTLAAALVFAVAFAAGQWQSGRAAEKDLTEARHAALRDAPALALPRTVAAAGLDALDGRRLSAAGEFLNHQTLFLDNQVQNRIAGYHVLTPFRAANGAVVLVNRGWVATGNSRAELPRVVAVTGAVSLEGRAALPPRRIYEIKPEAHTGKVWQNLLLPAMSKQAGVDLLPFVLRQTSDSGDGLVRVAAAAAGTSAGNSAGNSAQAGASGGMTAAKHRGYAFQWYSLAALVAVLFVFFTFIERIGPN